MSTSIIRAHCITCGKDFHPNFRVCPACGSFIQSAPSQTQPAVQLPAQPALQVTAQPTPSGPSIAAVDIEWREGPVAPWRRWAARSLDMSLNGLVMSVGVSTAMFLLIPYEANAFFLFLETPLGILANIIFSTLLACILTGLMIGATSSSVGKLIFGIRVTGPKGLPIGPYAGLMRDLEVWVKGLGLGIPFIAIFTQAYAYQRLTKVKSTTWDEHKHKITYRTNGAKQYVFNMLGMLLFFIILFTSKVIATI